MNRSVFLRQLRYWTFHCSFNALPSFCIALFFLQLWKSPPAIAAMVCAIGTFILLYATLTSLNGPLANEDHILSRSLRLGAKIRAWISGVSLVMIPIGAFMLTPDFWCGFLSVTVTDSLLKWAGGPVSPLGSNGQNAGFFPIYLTTLLEGFILSFLLLMISFFAVMFLQARDRRNAFRSLDPRRLNGI